MNLSAVFLGIGWMLFNVSAMPCGDFNPEKLAPGYSKVWPPFRIISTLVYFPCLTRAVTVSGALLPPPHQPDSAGIITAPLPAPTVILLNNVEPSLLLPARSVAAWAVAAGSSTRYDINMLIARRSSSGKCCQDGPSSLHPRFIISRFTELKGSITASWDHSINVAMSTLSARSIYTGLSTKHGRTLHFLHCSSEWTLLQSETEQKIEHFHPLICKLYFCKYY